MRGDKETFCTDWDQRKGSLELRLLVYDGGHERRGSGKGRGDKKTSERGAPQSLIWYKGENEPMSGGSRRRQARSIGGELFDVETRIRKLGEGGNLRFMGQKGELAELS